LLPLAPFPNVFFTPVSAGVQALSFHACRLAWNGDEGVMWFSVEQTFGKPYILHKMNMTKSAKLTLL